MKKKAADRKDDQTLASGRGKARRDGATGRFVVAKPDIKSSKYRVPMAVGGRDEVNRIADEAIKDTLERFDWTLSELAK